MDVAFAVAHERESGNVTVQCFKNRFGDEPSITVKPQFETGAGFEVTQDPALQRQHEEERVLLSSPQGPLNPENGGRSALGEV